MSEGINIILPGRDMDPEAMKKIAGDQPVSPADQVKMQQAEIEAEANAIRETIAHVDNYDVLPYKDDAPMCAAFGTRGSTPMDTRHHGMQQIPAWMHGRCIGAACAEWVNAEQGGICGRKLVQLSAGVALGVIDDAEVAKELERWAVPEEEAPAPLIATP